MGLREKRNRENRTVLLTVNGKQEEDRLRLKISWNPSLENSAYTGKMFAAEYKKRKFNHSNALGSSIGLLRTPTPLSIPPPSLDNFPWQRSAPLGWVPRVRPRPLAPSASSSTLQANIHCFEQCQPLISSSLDTVKLPTLPCCSEHPLQTTCGQTLPAMITLNRHSLSRELPQTMHSDRQLVHSEFDELDEIQDQLNAICFAKPEILTSKLTLTELNCSKIPITEDDLLRKYKSLQIEDEVELFQVKSTWKGKHPRVKKASKAMATAEYFPRDLLPFQELFDVTHGRSNNCKRKKFSTVSSSKIRPVDYLPGTFLRDVGSQTCCVRGRDQNHVSHGNKSKIAAAAGASRGRKTSHSHPIKLPMEKSHGKSEACDELPTPSSSGHSPVLDQIEGFETMQSSGSASVIHTAL